MSRDRGKGTQERQITHIDMFIGKRHHGGGEGSC